MKKIHGLIGFCLILLFCDSDQESTSIISIRPEHTFHMVQTTSIETLDPMKVLFQADWQIASMVYEGLVGYGENSAEIVPVLAEKWDVQDQGLRYVFHLRPDVYFHDDPCFPGGKGRKLSALDVVYTFHRLEAYQSDCPSAYLLEGKITQVKALDNRRIEFRLNQPYAIFLKILASPTTYIIPREAADYYGANFAHHPVGTGPFKLIRWKPFLEILLARHPRYWQEDKKGRPLPRLDAVQIKLESSREKEFNDFVRGENQLYRAETVESRELLENLFNPEAYYVLKAPFGLTTRFFGFSLDQKTSLARNPVIRKAMAMAFDRVDMFDTNDPEHCTLAQSLVPDGLLEDSTLRWHEPDISEAIRLMASQDSVHPVNVTTNIETPEILALVKAMQILSIPHELHIQKARYYPTILDERPDLFRVAYLPSLPDPEDYYAFFYSRSAADVNLTGYSNPEYDAAFEASRIELDPDRRTALFLEMESMIKRDVPVLLISHSKPSVYLYPKSVQGLKMRFLLLDFSEVSLDQNFEAGN